MDPRDNVSSSSHSTFLSTSSTQSPSHYHKPTPTSRKRRNEHASWLCHRSLIKPSQFFIFILLTCCLSISSATVYIDEQMVETPDASELFKSSLERLHRSGTLLVDQRPPPNPKEWTLATENDDLKRRDEHLGKRDVSQESTSSSGSMITTAPAATQTSTGTSTSSSLAVATSESASPLPSPFDQGFAGNVTDSCLNFMNGFLSNSTFKSCLPFSLLLQVSTPIRN